ncbi:hypothetical protein JNN96_29835 [Mycobacterium sp. DSM 3803]|nr:hypothetical protein [Mycobacterium sp. DSM 3803]
MSVTLEDLVGAIRSGRDGVNGTAAGKTPDDVVEAAGQAENAARDEATNAATRQAAVKILKDAVATWRKDAPKADLMNTAEKKLSDAKTADEQARAALAGVTDEKMKILLQPVVDSAADQLLAATTALESLKAKRKAANDAFERARKQAAEKLASIKTVDRTGDGDGYGAPGTTSTSPGTGNGTQTGGAPAAKPGGAPAAKPTGTPSPTSPAATPSNTSGSGKGADTETAALAAALAGQNQNQQPQAQQAAQQQMPTMPQVPQQNQQDGKGKDDPAKTLQEEAARNGQQALTAAGLGGLVAGSQAVTGTGSTPTPTPSTPQPTTQFRPGGTPIAGTGLGGTPAVNQQTPVTSGTSQTGLTTPSDTSGRSTPTPGAFDSTKTTTSAAHTTETGQGTQQQTTRPGGTGMPGMMPLAPGAAGPSYGSPAVKDKDGKVLSYGGNPQSLILNGWPALEETVRGGTICQAVRQENQALIGV